MAEHQITELLVEWTAGNARALDELMPLVYEELRRMSRSHLRKERSDHTLQPTALVHEAFMRLVKQTDVTWQSRSQFFSLASQMMRRILISYARNRLAAKRGGGVDVLSLDENALAPERFETFAEVDVSAAGPLIAPSTDSDLELLDLDDALTKLSAEDTQQGRIVELRYFGGLSIEETATTLGISPATVKREWVVARLWLKRALEKLNRERQ